jgi:hypothetical protein
MMRATTPIIAAIAFLCSTVLGDANVIRITTWNLEWFPNGSPKRIPTKERAKRIAAAADVLRTLNSDILLPQEIRDYDASARLAEAIRPDTYQVAITRYIRPAPAVQWRLRNDEILFVHGSFTLLPDLFAFSLSIDRLVGLKSPTSWTKRRQS